MASDLAYSEMVFEGEAAPSFLQNGADVRVVQELLGHASVTTTQIYTMVTVDTLKEMAGRLKARFPQETRVLIISEPAVIYDDIIHTMDALREQIPGAGDLFPDVTLSIF